MKTLVLIIGLLIAPTTLAQSIKASDISEQVFISEQNITLMTANTSWLVRTNCEKIELGKDMIVNTPSRYIKENTRLYISSDKNRQVCRITDVVSTNQQAMR